jgi:hypothetical protein
MALTYLKDAPDADLPKAVKISESDPGTDVGAYRWWGDPLPHGGPYTSVVLQLRNAANDGYITASQSVPWSAITGEPTTLAGYGITDAASATDLQDGVGPAWSTLVDGATITWDTLGAPYSQAKVTLGGNRTLDLTSHVAGAHGLLLVTQDGTGSRTLTLDGTAVTSVTLNSAASAKTLLAWYYDGTTVHWVNLTAAGGGGGTPDAHAASHAAAGSDPLTLAQSQITNLTTDLAAKAPLASPTFTGTPAAPTASAGTNTTQLATTAFVQAAVGHAPTAITSGTSMSHDCTSRMSNHLSIDTLGHNGTLTLSNLPDGGSGDIVVVQDGTGSRTLTLAHAGLTVVDLGSIASAASAISFVSFARRGSRLLVTSAGAY